MSDRQRKRGLLSAWSDALAPKAIPENDTGPLRAPKSVIAAVVLAALGGIIYVFWGGYILANIDGLMEFGRTDYLKHVAECRAEFGDIGTAITATTPTDLVAACQQTPVLTQDDWDGVRVANQVLAVVFLVLGLILVAAGYFLRAGASWARRTLVTMAVLIVAAAFLLSMSSPIILVGTLLVLIAVILCYLSSGATYFLRVKHRKHT